MEQSPEAARARSLLANRSLAAPLVTTSSAPLTQAQSPLSGRVTTLTPIGVCESIPDAPPAELSRDNILDGIEMQLAGDTRILALEGPDGAGKTTLLAQFARRHAERCLALFINAASRYAYHPSRLTYDLCNQLEMYVAKRELEDTDDRTEDDLRARLNQIHRQAVKRQELVYFVVDGLEEIPSEDAASRRAILDLLPLTYPRFRFLFSGALKDLGLHERLTPVAQAHRVPFFSRTESHEYFDGLTVSRETVDDIYKSCRGMPGYLAVVRAQIARGVPQDDILRELPATMDRLFAREWAGAKLSERQQHLLALVAYGRRRFTTEQLATVTGLTPLDVSAALTSLDFVVVGANRAEDVRFRSDSFRRFATEQLSSYREWAHERVIDFLQRDPESVEALLSLPQQFKAANRLEDLVEFLSGDKFAAILERSPSVKLVQQQADLGIAASRELGREADVVRLTYQRSTIASIVESDVGRSEIRALAALGDYTAALALAQGATRDEDRLMLLAAVSRAMRDQGLTGDEGLAQQISELHGRIDYAAMSPSRAEAIAADLAHAHIDLAIEAVSRATRSRGDNRLDWAFAKLAIRATFSRGQEDGAAQPAREIAERISDPLARRLSSEAMLILGDATADDAILEAERLESVGDQLYVLRQWMLANRTRSDAHKVVTHGVMRAIQASEYSANATVFRELATGLPYINDGEKARELIAVVDAQLPTIQSLGPTDDCVRLMLLLARAEQRHAPAAVPGRLMQVYFFVGEIAEYATKTACTARLLAWLSKIDPERALEVAEGLHSILHADFEEQIHRLLADSADHEEAAGGIIKALAWLRPDLALDVAGRLNTEPRRDEAYADIVDVLGEVPVAEMPVARVNEALKAIEDPEVRDQALAHLLLRVARRSCPPEATGTVSQLLWRAQTIRSAVRRVEVCAAGLRFCARHEAIDDRLTKALRQELRSAWEAIDEPWIRLEAGFDVVADLAPDLPAEARELAEAVRAFRDGSDLCDDSAALATIYSLRLAVRAYAGLLPRRLDRPEDLDRISRAIESVSALSVRIELWADLSLRLKLADRVGECQRIVDTHVKPLLRALPDADAFVRARLTIAVAPALYAAYPLSVEEMLRPLCEQERDEAYTWIALFLMRGRSVFDPYEPPGPDGYLLTYEQAVEVCHVVGKIEQDARLYDLLCDVVASVTAPRRADRYTRLQKQEIARLLKDAVSVKLPNRRHITHDGYIIAAQAQINRLLQHPEPTWDALVEAAERIPNGADRAYVLGIIAAVGFKGNPKRRAEVLRLAEDIVETIPTLVDRMQHYRSLGQLLIGVDTAASKEYCRAAMRVSLKGREQDVEQARRATIDMAYRVDPEFASALASELNDDPARRQVERRIGLHDLKKSLASRTQSDNEARASDAEFSRAAWMRLGALNAGRSDDVPAERTTRYLEVAARQPMEGAYPIYAWLTENAVRRYANTGEVMRFVYPLFEAALLGAELAHRSATRSSRRSSKAASAPSQRGAADTLVVGPGQRNEALHFIERWLLERLGSYLKVSDPYFTPGDIDLLRLVRRVRPDCQVLLLTSARVHAERHFSHPLEPHYRAAWRAETDDPEPSAEIVVAALRGTSDSPVHDRWWITEGSGLDVGTSWNSLGVTKESTVRIMNTEEAALKETRIDEYASKKTSLFNGVRIAYETVLLGDD